MNTEITVMYDPENPKEVKVGTPTGGGDPWGDLALLLEGVGVLVNACANNGYTEHNGQPVEEYLKDYIHKVCNDYKTSRPINQRN